MMKNKHHIPQEKGISLLIVLLIGSIILLTSIATGTYTIRMVRSLQARGDATQALYTAEQAFDCVKYWLNKDVRIFTDQVNQDVICNGTTFNFDLGTGGASFASNIGSFTIPTDTGEVYVEVDHTAVYSYKFVGTVRIYSRTGEAGNSKISERFQEYSYEVLEGADVMFVVDRSGSIDRGDPAEWGAMLTSITKVIRALNRNVPTPGIGIVSFGTDANDVGVRVLDTLVPEVQLTTSYTTLIDRGATLAYEDWADDTPNIETAIGDTNLSLGISIAGAELMGKAYPYSDYMTVPITDGEHSGEFERIVADDDDFDDLPAKTSGDADRPDSEYPDVIVLISDGAPNAIMTHIYQPSGKVWYRAPALIGAGSPYFVDPVGPPIYPAVHNYEIGEVKLFRTEPAGAGEQIIDDNSTAVPNTNVYNYCNDKLNIRPNDGASTLTVPVKSNEFPHFAMCNATLIVEKLKENQTFDDNKAITFIVVYVGDASVSTEEMHWLKNHIASDDPVNIGEKLFVQVDKFEDVEEAVLSQFEKLVFVQSL
jgi:hypothetical protein